MRIEESEWKIQQSALTERTQNLRIINNQKYQLHHHRVAANIELASTTDGDSRAEARRRAEECEAASIENRVEIKAIIGATLRRDEGQKEDA